MPICLANVGGGGGLSTADNYPNKIDYALMQRRDATDLWCNRQEEHDQEK